MREQTEKLIYSFYSNLEETLLAIMAAGVPANQIGFTEPKVTTDKNIVRMEAKIYFH